MNSNQHRLRLTPCVPENDEGIQELALEVLLVAREREALPPLQNRTEVYRDITEMRREKTLQTHSKRTTFLLSGNKPYVNPVQDVKTFERSIWGLTNVDLAGADDLGRVYLLLRSAQVRLAIVMWSFPRIDATDRHVDGVSGHVVSLVRDVLFSFISLKCLWASSLSVFYYYVYLIVLLLIFIKYLEVRSIIILFSPAMLN